MKIPWIRLSGPRGCRKAERKYCVRTYGKRYLYDLKFIEKNAALNFLGDIIKLKWYPWEESITDLQKLIDKIKKTKNFGRLTAG